LAELRLAKRHRFTILSNLATMSLRSVISVSDVPAPSFVVYMTAFSKESL
jgi:hypothetical protein